MEGDVICQSNIYSNKIIDDKTYQDMQGHFKQSKTWLIGSIMSLDNHD